jgi:hypothetical protein
MPTSQISAVTEIVISLTVCNTLILDFHHKMNTVFWFWGFWTVGEVNLLTTFQKLLCPVFIGHE